MRLIPLLLSILFLGACSPVAKFTYNQEDSKAPSDIKFENSSKNAERYEWNFGDGNTSQAQNPVHHYLLSGKYQVELSAYSKNDKVDKVVKEVLVKAPENCLVLIETDYGKITIRLYDETPKHRDNFLNLAESGFYNDLLFHRVIDGFMIQGGDPKSKAAKSGQSLGNGGPGYQIPAEFTNKHVHIRGALAAARMGDAANPEKKSSGSQFYIVHGSEVTEETLDKMETKSGIPYTKEQRKEYLENGGTPFLDHNYTVFGRVVEGMDVVEMIAKAAKDRRDRPIKDIKMKITTIR